jgi:uncharacterized membrane protein
MTYNSLLVATGGTPPYTYSITGTLPAGLSLNTATGVITGVPSGVAVSSFTAMASDSAAGSASSSCTINTSNQPSPVPAPPSFILVLTGLACAVLYRSRERITRLAAKS